ATRRRLMCSDCRRSLFRSRVPPQDFPSVSRSWGGLLQRTRSSRLPRSSNNRVQTVRTPQAYSTPGARAPKDLSNRFAFDIVAPTSFGPFDSGLTGGEL